MTRLRRCHAAGYGIDRIRIDPSVVRGLEYYTGPVYEVELLLETKDDKGRPVRFGSVGGGGRYDGLVSRFRGEPVPATGFSIGVSRLQAALTVLGKLGAKPRARPGGGHRVRPRPRRRLPEAWSRRCATPASAPSFISAIRRTISARSSNMPTSAASPCAVIQGGDEKARERSADQGLDPRRRRWPTSRTAPNISRSRPRRSSRSRKSELVEAVRKLLARHA